MRSQPSSWTNLLTILGFTRKMRPSRTQTRYRRKLRFEQVENRCMLATFVVTNDGDAPENTPAAVGTLRQAMFDANQAPDHDIIQFAPSLNGQTITITDGNLVATDRVMITGPTGAGNRITIQKGGASTATAGLTFSGFNLSPTGGSVTAQTGVRNLAISGFEADAAKRLISTETPISTSPLDVWAKSIEKHVQYPPRRMVCS